MNKLTMNVLIGTVGVLIVASMSMFVVDQRQNAIVFQLGEVKKVITESGLHFKVPLVQNVRFFDSRILTLDAGEPERFITAEKKNVMVDSFVKWRIVDVKQYYVSVGGDEVRLPNSSRILELTVCSKRVLARTSSPPTLT